MFLKKGFAARYLHEGITQFMNCLDNMF